MKIDNVNNINENHSESILSETECNQDILSISYST